jgi:hypothetical protein
VLSWLRGIVLWDVLSFLFGFCLLFGSGFFLLEALLSVGKHVKFERELAVIVDFDPDHPVEIELEPFE